MKSKIKYMLMMVFSFLFFFSFSTFVSAEDKTIEYDTYILKYDYSITNGDNVVTYKNKTYVVDFPKDLNSMEYVTYYVNVKNVSSESQNYGFGTYAIRDGIATSTKIRFEDTVNSNGITYFVIKNYDVYSIEDFMSSLIDTSFFESMVDSLNTYIGSNFEFAYLETSGPLITGYDELYSFDGLKYGYYDNNGVSKYEIYSTGELENLYVEKGYVFNNTSLTRLSDMYTVTDLEKAREEGYEDGFVDGETSIDITSDNDTVINFYIKENGLLTKEEGESKYNQGFNDGKEYVYNNLNVDVTVQDYIVNNYYTKEEYDLNFDLGYSAGKDSVYVNLETDVHVNEYVTNVVDTKVKETIKEKTNIKIIGDGVSDDVDLIVKKYNVDYSDTGDFTINVYRGQDNYIIDTEFVENTTTTVDYDLVKKIVFYAIVLIAVIVAFSLIGMGMSTPKKEKRRGYYAK